MNSSITEAMNGKADMYWGGISHATGSFWCFL